MRDDATTVDLLLANTEESLNLDILDKDGFSALGLAMREELFPIAYKILDQNNLPLDVSIGGGKHSTLLHIAIAKLDVKSVIKLLMRGIDVNAKDAETGDTPLHSLMVVFTKN